MTILKAATSDQNMSPQTASTRRFCTERFARNAKSRHFMPDDLHTFLQQTTHVIQAGLAHLVLVQISSASLNCQDAPHQIEQKPLGTIATAHQVQRHAMQNDLFQTSPKGIVLHPRDGILFKLLWFHFEKCFWKPFFLQLERFLLAPSDSDVNSCSASECGNWLTN